MVHQVVGNTEQPDLDGVGGQGEEDTEYNTKAMTDLQVGYYSGDAVQKLVVNHNRRADNQDIDKENQCHCAGLLPPDSLPDTLTPFTGLQKDLPAESPEFLSLPSINWNSTGTSAAAL